MLENEKNAENSQTDENNEKEQEKTNNNEDKKESELIYKKSKLEIIKKLNSLSKRKESLKSFIHSLKKPILKAIKRGVEIEDIAECIQKELGTSIEAKTIATAIKSLKNEAKNEGRQEGELSFYELFLLLKVALKILETNGISEREFYKKLKEKNNKSKKTNKKTQENASTDEEHTGNEGEKTVPGENDSQDLFDKNADKQSSDEILEKK